MIDPQRVRAHFPSLQRPDLFFDNPAGTQMPTEAIEAFVAYLTHDNANTGGEFATSQATGELIDEARAAMADFLGATSPREIAFGQNMTSLAFEVSHAIARTLHPGDEVVTTRLEHDANVSPWLALEERGIVVRFIDIHPEDVSLNMESAEAVITDRTKVVAVGAASNAVGTVNDVARIAEMAHAHTALVFVDAVHFAPHGPIDVQAMGCDLLICSPYKFFGPHLGVLYGRYDVLAELPSYHVRPAGNEPPDKWETGTQSHESLAALLGTIRYLEGLAPNDAGDRRARLHRAMSEIRAYEQDLSRRLVPGMQSIPGVRVLGITDTQHFDRRVPTVSFLIDGVAPADGARALGQQGIYSWAGNHYAVEPLRRLALEATQRIGLVHYNTADEIDRFLGAIEEIAASPI